MTFSPDLASTFYPAGAALWTSHSIPVPPFEVPQLVCPTNSSTPAPSESQLFHTLDANTCWDNNDIYYEFSTVMKGENAVSV